mmetsp:Transcript_13210/g.50590  ORF Transcript_13210/g.50590 Transcript_13210/m.50590 type:complete len:282 (+) Transcript_13210:1484-2329(+)
MCTTPVWAPTACWSSTLPSTRQATSTRRMPRLTRLWATGLAPATGRRSQAHPGRAATSTSQSPAGPLPWWTGSSCRRIRRTASESAPSASKPSAKTAAGRKWPAGPPWGRSESRLRPTLSRPACSGSRCRSPQRSPCCLRSLRLRHVPTLSDWTCVRAPKPQHVARRNRQHAAHANHDSQPKPPPQRCSFTQARTAASGSAPFTPATRAVRKSAPLSTNRRTRFRGVVLGQRQALEPVPRSAPLHRRRPGSVRIGGPRQWCDGSRSVAGRWSAGAFNAHSG